MVSPEPGDPTPVVGAPTDIAPIGNLRLKPGHDRTSADEVREIDWEAIAAEPAFKGLLHRKSRFIVPATIFFLVYYLALPALVGYAKPFMQTKVGPFNYAYLFALSQFFMAWIIAALYVRAANIFDRDAKAILDEEEKR
jgi:uncharacterized membrane protein (DUF485 family)